MGTDSSQEMHQHTLRFEGGVRAEIELSGTADLIPHVERELDRAEQSWRDRLDNSDGHGGMLTSHHQRDAIETLPKPLNWLVSDLIAMNERHWLRSGKWDTLGAERVLEQGLTNNQWRWVEEVVTAMDGEMIDGE